MIYLDLTKKEKESIKTPIDLLNILYNSEISFYTYKTTYYDEECLNVQCRKSTRRSFNDLIDLCQTYFPNISNDEVLESMLDADINNFYYCEDIKKIVFHNVPSCPVFELNNLLIYIKSQEDENFKINEDILIESAKNLLIKN